MATCNVQHPATIEATSGSGRPTCGREYGHLGGHEDAAIDAPAVITWTDQQSGRCLAPYPGSATLAGRPVLCDDVAGHPGAHGNSFAARWWDAIPRWYVVVYRDRPTFFLDANLQGILTLVQARRIAAVVLGDIDPADPGLTVAVAEDVTR